MRKLGLHIDSLDIENQRKYLNSDVQKQSTMQLALQKTLFVPWLKMLVQNDLDQIAHYEENGYSLTEKKQVLDDLRVRCEAYEEAVQKQLMLRHNAEHSDPLGPFFHLRQPLLEMKAKFHEIASGKLRAETVLPIPVDPKLRKHKPKKKHWLKKHWDKGIAFLYKQLESMSLGLLLSWVKQFFNNRLHEITVGGMFLSALWLLFSGFSLLPAFSLALFGSIFFFQTGWPFIVERIRPWWHKVFEPEVASEESREQSLIQEIQNRAQSRLSESISLVLSPIVDHFFKITDPIEGFDVSFYEAVITFLKEHNQGLEDFDETCRSFGSRLLQSLEENLNSSTPSVTRKTILSIESYIRQYASDDYLRFQQLVSVPARILARIANIKADLEQDITHSLNSFEEAFERIADSQQQADTKAIFTALLPQVRTETSLNQLRGLIQQYIPQESRKQAFDDIAFILFKTFDGTYETLSFFGERERLIINNQYMDNQDEISDIEAMLVSVNEGSMEAWAQFVHDKGFPDSSNMKKILEAAKNLRFLNGRYRVLNEGISKEEYLAYQAELKNILIRGMKTWEGNKAINNGFYLLSDREFWGETDYCHLRKQFVEQRLAYMMSSLGTENFVMPSAQESELLVGKEVRDLLEKSIFLLTQVTQWLESKPAIPYVCQWINFLHSLGSLDNPLKQVLSGYFFLSGANKAATSGSSCLADPRLAEIKDKNLRHEATVMYTLGLIDDLPPVTVPGIFYTYAQKDYDALVVEKLKTNIDVFLALQRLRL